MAKEATKEKLIQAVGKVLKREGYQGMTAQKLAREAGVDKSLIYRYFGEVDNLVEIFLLREDYWATKAKTVNDALSGMEDLSVKDLVNFFLEKQLEVVSSDEVVQKVMLWSISENHPLMEKLIRQREETGSDLFKVTDTIFEGSGVNYRAVSAILVAAIYYLSLHNAQNEGTFCELNLRSEEGMAEIAKAIRMINDWAFREAKQ